jgi:glycerol kinase
MYSPGRIGQVALKLLFQAGPEADGRFTFRPQAEFQDGTYAIADQSKHEYRSYQSSKRGEDLTGNRYILALDQGTTSSRTMIIDKLGQVHAIAQRPFPQLFPQPGWVEHDAVGIWSSQLGTVIEALASQGFHRRTLPLSALRTSVRQRWYGIARPVNPSTTPSSGRTAGFCDMLHAEGHAAMIHQKTGLLPDAYFSGSKVRWLLENVEGARERAQRGELAFGTIDSWLIWKLTNGKRHVTDVTNASRTMIFNVHRLQWDDELLQLLEIPRSMLPEVVQSSGVCGTTEGILEDIPIAGIAGDQQAALFGQMCTQPGMVKCTFGTGSFMLLHVGDKPVPSQHKLLTTVAWSFNGRTEYALEGSMLMAGAVVQWLRDELQMIRSSSEIEALAQSVPDSGGVVLVPAFSGLGAPHWDQYARGALLGMTRGTTRAHIARAALEGIALQVMDVLEAMQADSGLPLAELRVDGGAAANNLLMQMQADVLGVHVVRPKNAEATALGAAYLAGLGVGYWPDTKAIARQWQVERRFEPRTSAQERSIKRAHWRKALDRVRAWEGQ